MRDPYDVLGVPRGADEAQIKKAFRRLAKQHHPDTNANDPKAQRAFAEVNQAYEIVGDKEKRAKFDRGEIDAEGKPRFAGDPFSGGRPGGGFGPFDFEFQTGPRGRRGGPPPGFDPSDVFADFFAGGRRGGARTGPARGADLTATLEVAFVEAARGARKRISVAGRDLEVAIPAGIESGKQMRLRGQGRASLEGGEPGDLLITVLVEPDPLFTAEGADLKLDLPITFDEAVLGASVRVPTLDGPVELKIPPGSRGGRTLRLKGKGLPRPDGAGDLYVRLSVVLPEADDELRDVAVRLRALRPYAVRGPEYDR